MKPEQHDLDAKQVNGTGMSCGLFVTSERANAFCICVFAWLSMELICQQYPHSTRGCTPAPELPKCKTNSNHLKEKRERQHTILHLCAHTQIR